MIFLSCLNLLQSMADGEMLLGNGLRFRDLFYDEQLVDENHCNLDILNDLINGNKKDMVHPVLMGVSLHQFWLSIIDVNATVKLGICIMSSTISAYLSSTWDTSHFSGLSKSWNSLWKSGVRKYTFYDSMMQFVPIEWTYKKWSVVRFSGKNISPNNLILLGAGLMFMWAMFVVNEFLRSCKMLGMHALV